MDTLTAPTARELVGLARLALDLDRPDWATTLLAEAVAA